MKPTMYMLIGLPSSGKSTWTKQNAIEAVIVSSDNYIDEVAKNLGKTYTEVFRDTINMANARAISDFNKAVKDKVDIIIDRTNLTIKGRRTYIEKVEKAGYNIVAIVFDIPEDIRAERDRERAKTSGKYIPAEIINSMRSGYVEPTNDEGFDEIIHIRG